MTCPEAWRPRGAAIGAFVFLLILSMPAPADARGVPKPGWAEAWPNTDFSKTSIDYAEIISGGPPKDGIPAIDDPRHVPVDKVDDLAPSEPVISITINGETRAYPLRVLMWHEIANDRLGGVPIAVTYCPLCDAAVVFDRRVEGENGTRVLDFGTTGKLRRSDLVMYDRQTESWWQQFVGEAIVGELTGTTLEMLPSRVESWARFKERHGTDATVLVPANERARQYGRNPYRGYDSAPYPFLYQGAVPDGIAPMARVVAVGDEAWGLELVRRGSPIIAGDLRITWQPGQNSALDASYIPEGRDVGNVIVERRTGDGYVDAVYDVTFAFAFHAFHPAGTIHTGSETAQSN